MKKYFNKELVMTKENSKHWIFDNNFAEGDVKIRDHCHVTGKHRQDAHSNYNISVSLNQKIPIVLRNLTNYDAHLIMQKLGKFDFKINVIPNGLENYISFSFDKLLTASNS